MGRIARLKESRIVPIEDRLDEIEEAVEMLGKRLDALDGIKAEVKPEAPAISFPHDDSDLGSLKVEVGTEGIKTLPPEVVLKDVIPPKKKPSTRVNKGANAKESEEE